MTKIALVTVLFGLLLTAGCARNIIPVGIPCSVGPVILEPGASTRLVRSEKEQIATINTVGEVLCDWQPPR